ncbi:Imm50 family immunity protein [Candidatus Pantoea soli]|uniref:Imm50 family immunity protein n=1 Tax=Candidatus Pantoea soli TaxID=3098669 RepID=UPI00351CEE5E
MFKRDGPTVSIKLNLNEYPTKPPKKWEVQKFNTVQIVLSFLGVKSINMSGWVYTNYSMNLVVSRKNELISLSAKKDDFEINLESGFVDIDSISAYLK